MRGSVLRCIVLGFLVLTMVGGGWLPVVAQAAGRPCTMGMETGPEVVPSADREASDEPAPCREDRGGIPVCMQRTCCLAGVTLSVPLPTPALLVGGLADYPPTAVLRGGRSVEPELFPPIAA
jgi:hypothetical protein